jgi:hypothetical protein
MAEYSWSDIFTAEDWSLLTQGCTEKQKELLIESIIEDPNFGMSLGAMGLIKPVNATLSDAEVARRRKGINDRLPNLKDFIKHLGNKK